MYLWMQNKIKNSRRKEKGAVLPIVLAALLLLNIVFLGTHRIYRNQMNNYYTLTFHYQSQTLLALTEKALQEEYAGKTPPHKMIYNIGTVQIDQKAEGSSVLTSLLPNGFTEQKETTVTKKEAATKVEKEKAAESVTGKISEE